MFSVIISSSLLLFFFEVWSKATHFNEKYIEINVSKPMKHNKNVDMLLFLLLLTKNQFEKNIAKTLFVSTGAQKRWKAAGSGNTLPQYLPNQKNRFSVKCIFTWSIFALLPSRLKISVRHSRIVFELSYLNKTFLKLSTRYLHVDDLH